MLIYLGPGPSMFIISVFGINSDGGLAPAVASMKLLQIQLDY